MDIAPDTAFVVTGALVVIVAVIAYCRAFPEEEEK